MTITSRNVQGVEILQISGKLTIGTGDVQLRNAVSGALEAGHKNILLDLAAVSTVDSSGIGELVSSYTKATSRGAKLKLLKPSTKLLDILTITQLITVFDVHDDETSALGSFA